MRFSRIPILSDRLDNITGYVLKDNILEEIINKNGDDHLSSIRRDILVTNRNTPIPQLFDVFIAQREHIALVVDEFGSVSGLVSMEDVIETLLGLEIMDESDNVEDLQQLARKNWKTRAQRLGIIQENSDIE
jgi:CBS domain containing-hemolysin-like protein